MRKSWTTVGIGFGGALVVVGGVVAFTQLGSSAATDTEMVLNVKQTHVESIDAGAKGGSVGDRTVSTDDLYLDGKKVGTDAGDCKYTHLTVKDNALVSATTNCVITLALKDGKVTASGPVVVTDANAKNPVTMPITAGTGDYAGAHGTMKVAAGEAAKNSVYTLSFTTR
jgi:hypothetical protein